VMYVWQGDNVTTTLPQITLQCRAGHSFQTRARGGGVVRCPRCGAPKRVPAARQGVPEPGYYARWTERARQRAAAKEARAAQTP
jgi:hypothetical protein